MLKLKLHERSKNAIAAQEREHKALETQRLAEEAKRKEVEEAVKIERRRLGCEAAVLEKRIRNFKMVRENEDRAAKRNQHFEAVAIWITLLCSQRCR